MRRMDELLCRLLWEQLKSIGLFSEKKATMADLKMKISQHSLYDKWLEESLAILLRNSYLEYDGEFYTTAGNMSVNMDGWLDWNLIKEEYSQNLNIKAHMVLVEAMLKALPDILTGKAEARNIIFPNSSMERLTQLEKYNKAAGYFNEVVANTVSGYIQERIRQDSAAKLRIIEIGAGTGAANAIVFSKLSTYKQHIREYCYTDASRACLAHVQQEYGSDYLVCKLLDIDRPIAGQGVNSDEYDILIAVNSLHAVKDIRQALRNIKTLLRKNGLIVLNEISENSLFIHLTFGLLKEWCLYEDSMLRIPGCAGLYPEKWQQVLESEGFQFISFPATDAHNLGRQIIVAESDGVIRKKHDFTLMPDSVGYDENSSPINSDYCSKIPQDRIAIQKNQPETNKAEMDVTEQTVNNFTRMILRESIAGALKMETGKIKDELSFSEYGVDSIIAVNLVNAINKKLNITMQITALFDYNNVNQLVRHIVEEYESILISMLQEQENMPGLAETGTEPAEAVAVNDSKWQLSRFDGASFDFYPEMQTKYTEQTMSSSVFKTSSPEQQDDIAIIGMSGRFAKSSTVKELWNNLKNGTNLIQKVSRWDLSQYFDQNRKYCNYGSFLEDIDKFDPLFFNISGLEATYMDPRQRIFLEEAWKALEDAGYAGTAIEGLKCGVYVGCGRTDYDQLFNDNPPPQAFWGNDNAVIPARIAYYLNLKGPAVVVDTACSSSLVAIHLASQSLRAGETDLMLAGGIYLTCSPHTYLVGNRAEMLSYSGRCYTFDERADGFVPGEGVGVVVLKRLKEAIADGDNIYGVIRGSGINQDGRTNGITAPSALSQERLERYVYETFHIEPERIQMVEAHGTGTKLGDPIEFNALTRAFRAYTNRKQYCAIGSIKTNLGHAVYAAGVAGVIKVLLAMRHKKIPPTLNFQSGNPNINFEDSPFYVNTSLRYWDIDSNSKRCALVSSFGFSGTNAHIAIEEPPAPARHYQEEPGYLIAVSARTPEQLRLQIKQLVAYCEENDENIHCGDISYTLLLGRKHLHNRLACIVHDLQELVVLLKKWLSESSAPQVYYSVLHENDLSEKESLKHNGNQCIEKVKKANCEREFLEHLAAIAKLYIQGYKIEFDKLFSDNRYCRTSLPTYPFAKESYWVPDNNTGTLTTAGLANKVINHPLLHQNTSDFFVQRFSSVFTGQEFFLADHIVKGQRILPGVAYLEIARAAIERAAGLLKTDENVISLKNVVWTRPLSVNAQAVQMSIELILNENGEISYEVYSKPEANVAELQIHSQGSAVLNPQAEIQALDIKAIKAKCQQGILTAGQCYDILGKMGLNYGAGHQGIEQIYLGTGEVLAKLSLPSNVSNTLEQFVLHPSLLDSALQASIGLRVSSTKLLLPFALSELEIRDNCTANMWAFICYSDGSTARDKVQKLDIDLCDEQGKICVRMKGFSTRELDNEIDSKEADSGTILLHPCWQERAISQLNKHPDYDQHIVVCCEAGEVSQKSIEAGIKGVLCFILDSEQESIERRFKNYAVQLFEEIQSIFKRKPKEKILLQVVISAKNEKQLFRGFSGLLKTAQLENPQLKTQLIEADNTEELAEKLLKNRRHSLDNHIRYQDGKRWVAGWSEVEEAEQARTKIPWKDQGVYLISGGTGGLGLIFAKEIAEHGKGVTLILTGSSPLNEGKQRKLEELQALGAKIKYQQTDVTKNEEVNSLIKAIINDYGKLNGIIHCAGVIDDNFIIKKTSAEFLQVQAPKVTGLVNLDHASKDLPLDIFMLFSSVAGVIGNPGQADYSLANAFMDAYAQYRNELVAAKRRYGQTLSINWPLWQEGGMHLDEYTEKIFRKNTGIIPLETAIGIKALYQGLASAHEQVMVVTGNAAKIRELFVEQPSVAVHEENIKYAVNKTVSAVGADLLREKVIHFFKKLLSTVIKLPVQRIEADAPMEKYGIDSIMVMQMTNQLENTFGSLPKTLFFEYQSIQEIVGYFLDTYREKLVELLAAKNETETFSNNPPISPPAERPVSQGLRNRIAPAIAKSRGKTAQGPFDIAIIGVSGRYPGAKNIKEYWKNLQEGKDCISEIPKDRWDYSRYFDEDKNKSGTIYSKWGGFIEGVDQFDPLFFNISPREAEFIDPQERLFLQCVYETLEDAGYTRETVGMNREGGVDGNVGVYVGVMYEEYQLYGAQEQMMGRPIALTGSPASIANRVSYFCNFNGPSIAIDTMCSSSLTAIHLACQSLQSGGCQLAIAGGVNISVHPNKYLMLSQGKFLSSKGRCESFGQGGDGYVPGEGVGAVLLKPLDRAVADGDHIYGVIKGIAVNHGGKTNGYTVPNPNAQATVIGRALKQARINPRIISYIEAHGTGTFLGDPIEIAALSKTFQEYTADKQFCAIGSAKSNIGHCESAAGIAGVTKVLLQLKYHQLVPSLHSNVRNPNIDFGKTPFIVQQELGEWKRPKAALDGVMREYPRTAGISSFGAGGSNAHVVIEEYIPNSREVQIPSSPAIIVLSAKNEEGLKEQAKELLCAIEEQCFANTDLASMAYTLQVGREAMEERLAMTVGSVQELEEKLRDFVQGKDNIDDLYYGQVKRNKETLAVLATDEDMTKAIDAWFSKRKYAKLLELWVKGLNIDWNRLYPDTKPERISLPTYPFAKKRCWVPGDGNYQIDQISLANIPNSWDGLMYVPIWEEQPSTDIVKQREPHAVLIVYHESSSKLAEIIYDHYSKNKLIESILRVRLGNQTKQVSQQEWICDINDFESLKICLKASGALDCLYFISECRDDHSVPDFNAIIQSQQYNELQLLRLIKQLKRQNGTDKQMDCYIISQDNYSVGAAGVNPRGGGITGLAYSIAQGDHRFLVRNIDISQGDLSTKQQQEELIRLISNEAPTNRGELVKIKAGLRYKQEFRQLDTSAYTSQEPKFQRGGVYVILGGSGTVGGVITRCLLQKYNSRVVWIGRKPATSDTIRKKLESLQAVGEPPLYVQADVTNLAEMKNALTTIKQQYPVINGAIFAGIVFNSENSVTKTDEAEFLKILNTKTKGSVNFYATFKDEPLDFMCYFSSAQAFSFSGAANFSAYATGITFSDAFVQFIRRQSVFPIGIINWGFWKSSIVEAGEKLINQNTGTLQDKEGFECFERFVNLLQQGKLNQVICLKATKSVLELMKCKDNEVVSLNESSINSLIGCLWGNEKLVEQKLALLYKNTSNTSEEINSWLAKMLFVQLRRMGLFRLGGIARDITLLRNSTGIVNKYDRWLDECLNVLQMRGYIQCIEDMIYPQEDWNFSDEELVTQQWEVVKEAYLKDADWKAQVRLAAICLQRLPEILRGEILATDVMFPNSSMEMVEGIYKDNILSDFYNSIMADAVEEYVRQWVEAKPKTIVRIIEVGAGTGGTSKTVLARLKPYVDHVEYCYTDISKSFLLFAEKQYGPDNPYLRYKLWNVEKPVAAQGIEIGSYDIVIAANVLHATKNIRQTLRNIKAVLKRNGILLINEVTQKSIFTTLTFGLLNGWWLYEDENARITGSPLIRLEMWKKILEEEGYRQVQLPTGSEENTGQDIIAAESDGIVRKELETRIVKEDIKENPVKGIAGVSDQSVHNDAIMSSIPTANGNADNYIENAIRGLLAELLKVSLDDIDGHVAFSDYGVDSIIGVSLVNRLNELLGTNINSAVLFDYTTADRLKDYLVKTYKNQIKIQLPSHSSEGIPLQNDIKISDTLCQSTSDCTPGISELGLSEQTEISMIKDLQNRFFSNEISTDLLVETLSNKYNRGVNNG
ncbi:MAG TPA: SDR family NAD(P)-dependent oxidoreductase [Methylomusa anaerophila]|uniref:Polyketide synthase PksL n=1 Tax=Methylomusa anaerophila TaxID=1930071 RepID=A0A348AN89_9FIRM|nr:SDR family NAD(P)-dependent oxidoreductase [Methylomusa anaerophila]BBB92537.1 polyketide synthase PksL [Methylomusa anaerophila]HML87608.1 SDR family NAD(P)-dependent oxidoreductase [Methylomusa anaerophila]